MKYLLMALLLVVGMGAQSPVVHDDGPLLNTVKELPCGFDAWLGVDGKCHTPVYHFPANRHCRASLSKDDGSLIVKCAWKPEESR